MKSFDYFAPQSLGDATALLRRYGTKARLLAGGTDLFLRMERRVVEPGVVVDLKKVRALQGIKASAKGLTIRATTLMDEIVSSHLIQRRYRIVADAAAAVGSIQTRNRATLGGNLCNASPAADTAPPLIALGARARIAGSRREREISLEDFFLAPGKTCLQSDELLKEIFIPSPAGKAGSSFQRCTRTAMDIALVNCAVFLSLVPKRGLISDIRIALGAVAPTPVRARPAEDVLRGKNPDRGAIEEAAVVATASASPIDDVRSSASYRREMVRVLTRRAIEAALKEATGK
ncbi:MAG: xanthine dehydrogenase family protein subunit M [Deltaproteobacteria bacterium]|nr:xanthine dehydrogenase family protein subunit M [Deltaproteobacteria bacterium]MBI2228299.1 xanthine dehydrogenase family protein subunit M [Deltaproteobacteria bacterium]MBI2367354.1 xanthine dehydrogenase family protein subunit M [Deltaproteobacteria bacterium]MBI2531916.1 xanthine dehydrogenase family protein subunit M [Deltaproteobacteria bacterium]MBI3064312.1 xanthine dehydrogenase family protein subunit M [Deltaproteobacteria bacterium]